VNTETCLMTGRSNPAPKRRQQGSPINYGEPMGSCSRETFYPQRAAYRAEVRRRKSVDPLERKRFFACGEAARRGWMVMVWDNPYMRAIVRERIQAERNARLLEAQVDHHLAACSETECAEGCLVQTERDAEYAAGHEWHGGGS